MKPKLWPRLLLLPLLVVYVDTVLGANTAYDYTLLG